MQTTGLVIKDGKLINRIVVDDSQLEEFKLALSADEIICATEYEVQPDIGYLFDAANRTFAQDPRTIRIADDSPEGPTPTPITGGKWKWASGFWSWIKSGF